MDFVVRDLCALTTGDSDLLQRLANSAFNLHCRTDKQLAPCTGIDCKQVSEQSTRARLMDSGGRELRLFRLLQRPARLN